MGPRHPPVRRVPGRTAAPARPGTVTVTVCWGVKGGSGTTVVAATLAVLGARSGPTLLIDLGGDSAAALGLPDGQGPGVAEWLRSANAGADALARLAEPAADGLQLISPGHHALGDELRWADLGDALRGIGEHGIDTVVVDAGTGDPHPALLDVASEALLVIRPCYLALRRATVAATRPTGIVLVSEPGRALRPTDVEHALGAPVVATVAVEPAVARAVDAGLLAARLPRTLAHQLRGAA